MVYEFEKEKAERALKGHIFFFNSKFLKEIHSYENENGNYIFFYKYYGPTENMYIVTTYPNYVDILCYWLESSNSIDIE